MGSADTGAREPLATVRDLLDRAFTELVRLAYAGSTERDSYPSGLRWRDEALAAFDALAAGVGVPPDAARVAELESALRQARANHLGDQRIANEMVNHFPVELRCDHDTKRDKVICDCARVDLGWHPSIRAAKEAWATHVIEAVKDARAVPAGVGEARPAARPLQINPEPLAVAERHDDVSAVNWIRGRSREDRLRVLLALGGTEADFPDPAVGEARPAAPPTEVEGTVPSSWLIAEKAARQRAEAERNTAYDQKVMLHDSLETALAECGRLREQLDAANKVVDAARALMSTKGMTPPIGIEEEQLVDALGVVGPPPNQTTDEVSALGQKASETREGES